jgi:dihydroxy-acid dehydratase
VPFLEPSGYPDAIHKAGGEPVPVRLLQERPPGGIALVREWISDVAEVSCAGQNLGALLLAAEQPEELAGLLIAARRLNLPSVCAASEATPFSVALVALGLLPLSEDAADVAVRLGEDGSPRPGSLVEEFSLANALRAGLSAGGGPELMVHLCAIARESGAIGSFMRMMRVLTPETRSLAGPEWLREHGIAELLSLMGDTLHDTPTVAHWLKETLPVAPPVPQQASSRIVFVRGRSSGTEAVCRVPMIAQEAAGECRVFDSEKSAIRAVLDAEVQPGSFIVVNGCGPRGGPGLTRLDQLGKALRETGLDREVTVLTDGLPPREAEGIWISLVTPEAAAGGITGQLRDGDTLRIDFEEGRIRTGVKAKELAERESMEGATPTGMGYAARYARSALPALEGAGFR